jgi:hypothetical protein
LSTTRKRPRRYLRRTAPGATLQKRPFHAEPTGTGCWESHTGTENPFKNRIPELMAMNPKSPQGYAWGSFTKEWGGHPTFDEMNDFSDLEMSTIEVGFTANYHITNRLMLNFNLNYDKFNDDEYYIYDGDGSITYVGFGIQYQL